MTDWSLETIWRNFTERPILAPIYRIYPTFMNIERHSEFPFYVSPGTKRAGSWAGSVTEFLDWLVDAHEENRNVCDYKRSFYARSVYFIKNYVRYSNPTVANVMFDT